MFGNNSLRHIAAAGALFAAGSSGANDLELEPCINGAVSPSGSFTSAQIERAANGYQTWADFAPYYLFAVSATYLESPFALDEERDAQPDEATN